jgi:hypothetical protein
MFSLEETPPDGYILTRLDPSFPAGATAPVCLRCGSLIAANAGNLQPTPYEQHDRWHKTLDAALESAVDGYQVD